MKKNRKPQRLPRPWEDDYKALITAVGALVIDWGMLERQVDQWITLIFVELHGKRLADRGMVPKEFTRKAKFLRACFRRLAPLKPYREEALQVIGEAEAIAAIRNNIIHGALRSLKAPRGVFTFDRLNVDEDGYQLRHFKLNLRAYRALHGRFSGLVTRAGRLSQSLLILARARRVNNG